MRSIVRLLPAIVLLFASFIGYSQAIDISLATATATSPLTGGDTDQMIFAFQLHKAGGGANTVNGITVLLTQDPTTIISSATLYRSNDNIFDATDLTGNFTGTLSTGPNRISFTGSPVTNFGGGAAAGDRWFFLVIDISPDVPTTTLQPSITQAQITATGTVNNGTATGTNYTINALQTTIASLNAGANNVAASPLVGSATNKAIFGFSLTSNGSQTVTDLEIPLTSTPTGKFTSFSLVRSADTDFATANTTINGLTFTPTATKLTIAGLNEDVSTTKNYFLVVTVDDAVTTGTAHIQASLDDTGVTVDQGGATGSATGTDYAFTAPVTTLSEAGISGLATSPLAAASTEQALMGFSLTSTGNPDFTGIDIHVYSGASSFTNFYLYSSNDNTFDGSDVSTGAIVNVAAGVAEFSGLNIQLSSTPKYFFFVADVASNVNNSTPTFQSSYTEADVSVNSGTVANHTTTSIIYSFVDTTPPSMTFNPDDGDTNIPVSTTITITFDEAIYKTGTTPGSTPIVNADLATLVELKETNNGGTAIPFTATITGNVITITPNANLTGNQVYYVEMNPVDDVYGNASTAQHVNFTTEQPPNITNFSNTTRCIGDDLTVTGTLFGTSVPTVTIDGITVNASDISAHSATAITFKVPAGITAGARNVTVTNNDNGLSGTSSGTVTFKAAINLGLTIYADPAAANVGGSTDLKIDNSQNGVSYQLILIDIDGTPDNTNIGNTKNGNSSTLSFASNALPGGSSYTEGVYTYKFSASSTGCTTRDMTTQPIVTVAALAASAGNDATICRGESVTLGGNPVAVGGTTFYQIKWTIEPGGINVSSQANPVVSPTTTTTYRVTVKDDAGSEKTDDVTITVNDPTPAGDLTIVNTPSNGNVYSNQDNPVVLSFLYAGPPASLGTGIFSGPGVNSSNSKFYPAAANIGVNTITLSYTNPDNCVTTKTLNVNVFDNSTNFSGFEPKYCNVNTQDAVTPNAIPGYTLEAINVWHYDYNTFQYTINTVGITSTGNPNTYNFNPQVAANGFMSVYGYALVYLEAVFHDNATGLLKTSSYNYTLIYDLPKVTAFGFSDADVCKNGQSYKLSGTPAGGVWSGPGITPASGNDANPSASNGEDGLAVFNPANGNIGNNTATYLYEDGNGCQNTAQQSIIVKNIPTINFTFANKCAGDNVNFIPNEGTVAGVTGIQYTWNFGDDEIRASTTLSNPTVKSYAVASIYDVVLREETSNGCVVTSPVKQITIGEVPTVDFTWSNVCEGTATTFDGSVGGLGTSTLASVEWDMTEGGYVIGPPSQIDRSYSFTAGSRMVKLKVNTSKNCFNEVSKFVYTVPVISANNIPFTETFDTNDGQWIASTSNEAPSSWAWGVPAAPLIHTDASLTGTGSAWVTNLTGIYNKDEDSWVHSPCFDLSDVERPIIQLDIRSLTPQGFDGAVLQYNTSGSTDNDADWKNVGAVGEGDNWFDQNGILSKPGNQDFNQAGWTGQRDSTDWRSAKLPLDDVIGAISSGIDKVRFRIAFGNYGFDPVSEGFAFDNFDIHQRDRIVLLENFANSGGLNPAQDANRVANDSLRSFEEDLTDEVIRLQYHLGINGPSQDPLYLDNTVDANARAGYYGVTSTPSVFMDASRISILDIPTPFKRQSLKGAQVEIDTIFTTNTPDASKMNIEVRFTAKKLLPANTTLHIAVIEKEIIDAQAQGTNGETSFQYVMKKMLPSALGTKYTASIANGETKTVNVSWSPKAYNFNNLAVVAFVQNELTKEIYQARILRTPQYIPTPGVITDVEQLAENAVLLYPNPAQNVIKLEIASPDQDYAVTMYDAVGKPCYSSTIKRGEHGKEINSTDLTDGVYLVKIKSAKRGEVWKKVVIAR